MKPEPHLRPARADDCERVWQWNFAPDVRAMSGSAEPVSLRTHAAWFARRLLQPGAPMWIIEVEGEPVGVVRVDAIVDSPLRMGRISIALAPDARGRGIGKSAIAIATRAWGGVVEAQIHPSNLASRACFEACGFRTTAPPMPAADALLSYSWSP